MDKKRYYYVIGAIVSLLTAGMLIWFVTFYERVISTLPDIDKLIHFQPSVPTVVYSRDGQKIGEFFDEKRYPVALDQVSPFLTKAFIASEDARFYEHSGIDYQGLARAVVRLVVTVSAKQGGSTITQQLVKNVLTSREKKFERKMKDILLAQKIELALPKDKILELYLNTIFLGNNSYGVESAARNYFRKNALDLTLGEASLIAGLAPAPSAYAPTENLGKAKVRQRFVLEQMVKNKFITPQEMDKALTEELRIHRAVSPNITAAPYFLMEVKRQLEKQLKIEDLVTGGYRVETTLDMRVQPKVQAAVQKGLTIYESRKGFKGPLKRHGENYLQALKDVLAKPLSDEETERAFVVDIFPDLDAVAIASQKGLGVLLAEDHRWALSTSQGRNSQLQDFANILSIGDEVNVKALERKTPKRIAVNVDKLRGMSQFVSLYQGKPQHEGIVFYQLTDTEGIEAAAVIMDPTNGDVLAMVGGESFAQSEFNRATQAKRQVGSAVKPLYYGLAQDAGFSPMSLIDSPPIVIGDWKPENYGKEFVGRTTLRTSLIHSYNISSIQLFQALGPRKVTDFLNRFGFNWPSSDMSIALGSGNASLLEIVQAYSVFSNAGKLSEARYVLKVTNRDGAVIIDEKDPRIKVFPVDVSKIPATDEENNPIDPYQIITPEAAYVTTLMMRDVVRFGTANAAAGLSPFVGGKTGTTNGYSDAWFVGVMPRLVGGVWMGYDDQRKSLGRDGTGGRMAGPIWREVMRFAMNTYPSKDIPRPEKVSLVNIDLETGAKTDQGGYQIGIVQGTEPGSQSARNALGMLNSDGTSGAEESQDDASSLRGL